MVVFHGILWDLPSGYVKIASEFGPFAVNSTLTNGDFPELCGCLPDGDLGIVSGIDFENN